MKSEFKDHIKNIIGKLVTIENSEYNDKVCFLKHYSGFSIEEEDIINIMTSLNLECDMLYYRFDASTMQGAFCPFLEFVRELYNKYYSNMDCNKFVEEAGGYPVVESIFTSYINNGFCERDEDIIPRETTYEQGRIIESFVELIKYISNDHKMVIVLDRVQAAQESTISVLLQLMKCKEINNLVIVGAYNEAQDAQTYMKDTWNSLVNYIKDKGMAIDYDDKSRSIIEDTTFTPTEEDIEKYLSCINDLFLCLALEQAKYYLDIIYKAIENDNLEVDDKTKMRVFELYALVTLYNGEDKVAYVYSKKMYDIEESVNDKEFLIRYYYIVSLINHLSGQINIAYRSINEARKILKDLDNEKLKIKIDMLELVVTLEKFPEVLLWNPKVNMPSVLVDQALRYNQKLHLAYAYIYGFNMSYDI